VRVLIDYRPALRERSGAGEYTHQLVKALLAVRASDGTARLEVSLFSSSWKDRLAGAGPAELAGASIVDRRVPVRVLNFAWHRLGWPPAELLARRRLDVTHSSHPLLLPARDAAQVITIHDLNFLTHPERTRAEIRRDYPALVADHARRADRILVPSRFTAREIERRLDIGADKVSLCPPGAPDWTPRGAAPAGGYILFVGTLEPRKNVGALLDAYEQLARTRSGARLPELVLAGHAADGSHAWLDRIARAPLAGLVRRVGYVDPARRRELYAGARLLVMPSFEEGFGLPVLEAMTLGVPVVASDRGALPEVLGDAGPLVDPERPSEMAAAIAKILDDEPFAAGCARVGVARSREFRWDRTAAQVCQAYGEAIERRSHASRTKGRALFGRTVT
jgi:glycosyltransferase involved in cell wall biosynthesis